MPDHECRTAACVHDEEVRGPVQQRRLFWRRAARRRGADAVDRPVDYPLSDGTDLVGVSLSGGGIRSAMFNLGLLQAFQAAGLMKHVDFLSSVSGGGYTNGYFSTLGHFAADDAAAASGSTPESEAKPAPLAGLSPRDTQFLLEGQYLNRPVEFLTSYVLSTLLLLTTVVAGKVAASAIVALYFRAFDWPAARRWLDLFDIRTDLATGIFASVLLGVLLVLLGHGVRRVQTALGFRVHRSPGRWAVVLGFAVILGISVMIGSAEFTVSEGHGWLPSNVDLRSLQAPITIAVILLFSPLLRVGALLQSERATASPWQRLALRAVLIGTTWGFWFAVVGLIGRANVSGFATSRPPTLIADDVRDYGDLARLLEVEEDPRAENSMRWDMIGLRHVVQAGHRDKLAPTGDRPWALADLQGTVQEVLRLDRIREEARLDLWPSGRRWTGWRLFGGATLSRWLRAAGAFVGVGGLGAGGDEIDPHERVLALVNAERLLPERGRPLVEALNRALGLVLPAHDPRADERGRGEPVLSRADMAVTIDLCRLAAARVRHGIGPPEELATIAATEAGGPGAGGPIAGGPGAGGPAEASDEALAAALRELAAWDGVRLGAGGAARQYRQLTAFRRLLAVVMMTPARPVLSLLSPVEHAAFNRMLLEIAFPHVIRPRTALESGVVVAEDQRARRVICAWAVLTCLTGLLVLDLNRVCAWFHFYRDRVAQTFLRKAHVDGAMPLRCLDPTRHGQPYPLFVAGLFLPQAPAYGKSADRQRGTVEGTNPSKLDHSVASNWYSFLFSPLHVGWLPTGPSVQPQGIASYRPTAEYRGGTLGVEDAIVLSGAAITPYMAENFSLRVLMHVFNARLEQWLPNPRLPRQPDTGRFSMVDFGRELFSQQPWGVDAWRYGVVADGGFREFLGVEELVARRCRLIIVSDAGCNNGLYEFGVLADLVRKLRLDHGVEVRDLDHDRPLDTKRLRRLEDSGGRTAQHFILGRIRYPERTAVAEPSPLGDPPPPREALLVYVQMSLTGDEDIDIEQFRRTNPRFPDEPISNQFYSRDQVESFRQLGQHIGQLLCRGVESFDCIGHGPREGDASRPAADEERLRAERISRLVNTFGTNYRNDCRQESTIAADDARMGWAFARDDVGVATLARVHRYESQVEHQLLIHDFVWLVLDDTGSDRMLQFDDSGGDADRRLARITPMDLFGIAIECNRRRAGFRAEWPTAFFQVGGRELLIKAADVARRVVPALDAAGAAAGEPADRRVLDEFAAWSARPAGPAPRVIRLLARLAVMLRRGVFRQRGDATAADTVACLVVYLLRYRLGRTDAGPFDWIQAAKPQSLLRRAVATGKPIEVQRALVELFRAAAEASPPGPPAAGGSPARKPPARKPDVRKPAVRKPRRR